MLGTGSPKYQMIADELRRGIDSGQLKPGAALPSQDQLMSRHGVSLTTVRQAINQLRSEGWVRTEKGRGIFAVNPVQGVSESVRRKMRTIGVAAIGEYSEYDPLEQVVLRGALSVLQPAGKELSFAVFPHNNNLQEDIAAFLKGVSGLLIRQEVTAEVLKIVMAQRVKTVVVGYMLAADPIYQEFNHVCCDGELAGYLGGQMLALHEHRKVGFVFRRESEYMLSLERGFERAAKEYGMQQGRVVLQPGTDRSSYENFARQISQAKDLTAILVPGDDAACRIIHELRRWNIRVPEDVSVVGIGGLPHDHLMEHGLARVSINTELSGRMAAEILLANYSNSVHKTVPVTFEKGRTLKSRKEVTAT